MVKDGEDVNRLQAANLKRLGVGANDLPFLFCFAGPVYISILFTLGQDGEKFIHHALCTKIK